MINRAEIEGRITRDPILGQSKNGVYYCRVNIFCENENKSRGDFFNIVIFGDAAQEFSNNFKKGNKVLFGGRIQSGSYFDKKGNKIKTFSLIARRFELREEEHEEFEIDINEQTAIQTNDSLQKENKDFVELGEVEEIPF